MTNSYAIVQLGGKQYQVRKGEEILVDRLSIDQGKRVELNPLLVVDDKVSIGRPKVENATIKAKVLEHLLGDKIQISTYKKGTNYHRKKGFRPRLTRLLIEEIKRH